MALNMTTFSIMALDTVILSMVMLVVVYTECCKIAKQAECRYADRSITTLGGVK